MNNVDEDTLQKSQRMAIELGIPLRISVKSIVKVQMIFTILALLTIFYFAPELYARAAFTSIETVSLLVVTPLLLIATFLFYAISDAVIVNGELRIKNILVKPRHLNLLMVNKVWMPFGPESKIAVIFYHGFKLFPPFSIIIIPNWIPSAASLRGMILYGKDLSATISRPEIKLKHQQ
ncbi:MAG TPA: hypothetical protein VMW01_01695 [Williamwhitmania sp.]|jgi:hypothetical protein|nr:hypothetical protein [Williamwhitmania sp.]